MLMTADFLTRNDHNQIPHIAHFMLIVSHKFPSKLAPLTIFGDNAVPVDCNIHCLLHLVAHYLANQGSARVVTRRVVDEVPAGDSRHVGEFLVCHLFYVANIGRAKDCPPVVIKGGGVIVRRRTGYCSEIPRKSRRYRELMDVDRLEHIDSSAPHLCALSVHQGRDPRCCGNSGSRENPWGCRVLDNFQCAELAAEKGGRHGA
mmetsp:Transcript_23681/g.47351  ORF Transcript_23681/g.47351 Transcript_23681/m.47351 type:complete len:203 (+) Transcript_23681:413-1021(+)